MKKKLISALILLLFVMVISPAFAEDEVGDVASVMNSASPIPAGHFAIIAKYADLYLSNPNVSPSRAIDIAKFDTRVFNLADFYIVDIRSAADFAKGHIPGAVNIPFATIAKPESIVTYPTDRPILAVCYTGHTASMTSSILNTLGYNAWVLRTGMLAWNCSTRGCEK